MHYFMMQVSACISPIYISYVWLQEYTMIAIGPMRFCIRVLSIQNMRMYCLKLNKTIYISKWIHFCFKKQSR